MTAALRPMPGREHDRGLFYDRALALVELVQSGSPVTPTTVAEALNVSKRTARRWLQAWRARQRLRVAA